METERLELDPPCPDREAWRPVIGFEHAYSVSDTGRVRRDAPGKGARAGHVLRAAVMKSTGYRRVTLVTGGVQSQHLVHRLVAAAFIGPCPPGWSVNHKDTNKLNNHPGNLEYLTLADNTKHAWASGLYPSPSVCRHGHRLDETNTFLLRDGERGCRTCRRERQKRHKTKIRDTLRG